MNERNTMMTERNAMAAERKLSNEVRVIKRCPQCGRRLFDKITTGTGVVETKCPQCKSVVQINLAFRLSRSRTTYVPKLTSNF